MKAVTPAEAGVQNYLNSLDSRFRGNDEKGTKRTFYEIIKGGKERMKVSKIIFGIFLFLMGFIYTSTAFPLDKEQEKEFQRIREMSVRELTATAKAAIEKKYPGEDWEKFKFPKYVYTNDAVQAGYKIAVKDPQLLGKFPCYCFCEEMGHKSLAYCFLEKGVVEKFDDHASTCNICYTQAMRAFLWNQLGAKEEEIQKAFKEIYGK